MTGAAGFIGRRLAFELRRRGRLDGRRIDELILVDRRFDASEPEVETGLQRVTGDLRDGGVLERLFARPVDAFFHLAATLTAEAEEDFDAGLEMNLQAQVKLLQHCRGQGSLRLVFTSSMAAFGGVLPSVVSDELPQRPQTSYGVQKVVTELLLDDFTRRGFLDGRGLRLPVVLLRPANAAPALSEHISAFVREPLFGRSAPCPFMAPTRMPVASVGATARALIRVFEAPSEAIGPVRTMNLPALSVSVAEMAEAVVRRAGEPARQLIQWDPVPGLQELMDRMPQGFTSKRAQAMGIAAEADFDAVIEDFLVANEGQAIDAHLA